ncbi:hypothetical protein [Bordetella pertussis]|nr:hypothetical protein [Bordetella pertussis]ETH27721.1 hypothetical protein L565_1874 [Bordetella pertussis CHLA-20]ETH75527.1 hypothetical protein L555_1879 [Bordetella pertussis STO1-CHOC-0008]
MHGSSEPDLRCTHLQTQPGRIQPIDSSQLGPSVLLDRSAARPLQ